MILVTQPPIQSETARAGTKEWLQASQNMTIVAYVGARAAVPLTTKDEGAPGFGTQIKEAVK
ncbi:MAG: hypothetical protein L0Z62_35880 [Gemmataceae bacterium]|nr:hypothetical protein [Gemmataceae bacterium]